MLTNKQDIINWLEDCIDCKNYNLIEDHTYGYVVDIHESFVMAGNRHEYFPVKFNEIKGDFHCSNCSLKSLIGAPNIVHGCFDAFNNQLTSLEHCPKIIMKHFSFGANKIKDLLFFPQSVSRIYMGSEKCFDKSELTLEQIYKMEQLGDFEEFYQEHKRQINKHLKINLEQTIKESSSQDTKRPKV